jgi:hypothetical protein
MMVPRLVLSVFATERFRDRVAAKWGVAVAGLMIAASAATIPRCYALPKQDFTGARDFVETSRHPDEAVAAVGLAGRAYREYFAPHWHAPEEASAFDALLKSQPGLWVVYTLPIELKAYRPEIWKRVDVEFETVKVFWGTLGGGEVYVCRRRSGPVR